MKILIISSDTKSLIDFRSDLMLEMKAHGNTVIAAAPENEYLDKFEKLGIKFQQLKFDRTSTNPMNDIKFFRRIIKIIRIEKPDMLFSYAIKPVIYGSLAARLCKVKYVKSLLPGLGYAFNQSEINSIKDQLVKKMVRNLLKLSCKYNDVVMVQNPDDRNELINNKIITKEKCVRVNSSGVNFNDYYPVRLPQKPVFIMASRLLKDKGVLEYIKAAKYLKPKYKEAKFLLLGPFDSNPTAVKENELQNLISDGSVQYLGKTDDVRPFITNASVFVLPSYYREGVPRSIQEAMAMGRAIITTDWVGCRETVKDGFNGFLVEPKNTDQLIEKMEYLIKNSKMISDMGTNSERYCREKFDVNIINKQMMDAMKITNSQVSL
jgi:glycosyltransferase involved in cell wall biosynthesis